MEQQLIGGRIINTGEYTVMRAWSDGTEFEDIGKTERIVDFETIDDVRKMLGAPRKVSEEQKEAAAERLRKMREERENSLPDNRVST